MAAPKSLPSPSPERVSVFTFPTPLSDLLFWEKVDIANQRVWDMEKGDPHWDTVSYPSHKLVHKQPLDQGGKWQQYFYAAPRENQDAYNWEFSQADIGGTKFDSVVRTYVTLRSDYTPSAPAQGSAMPNVPADMFGTGTGTPSVITAYVLAGRKELKLRNELDGLFVAEQLEYVKRVSVADISTDRTLGVGVKKTTTLYYRGEILIAGTPGTTIEAAAVDPTNAYWGLQADGIVREVQQLTANWWAVIETSSLDAALAADFRIMAGTTDLRLPDVLRGISVTWNKDAKAGSFDSTWQGVSAWVGEVNASLSASESANADGSASVQPTIVPDIVEHQGTNIPCKDVFFNLKLVDGEITEAALIARLNTLLGIITPSTVIRWPKFHPEAHTFVCKGQRVSVSAQVSASAAIRAVVNGTDENNNKEKTVGVGEGVDFSTMFSTDHLRPTIHGIISAATGNFTGNLTDSANATATCSVGWSANSVGVGDVAGMDVLIPTVSPTTEGYKTSSVTASGSVYPTSLAATSPDVIPSSGIYITKSTVSPMQDNADWCNCYAEIVNAADIQ